MCQQIGMQFNSATRSCIIRVVLNEQRSTVDLSSLLFAVRSSPCCSQQTSSEMRINEGAFKITWTVHKERL